MDSKKTSGNVSVVDGEKNMSAEASVKNEEKKPPRPKKEKKK